MKKEINVILVIVSVFIVMFMMVIEGIIVIIVMLMIVGLLYGMEIMNWVFLIYLLINVMFILIYGKFVDKVGWKLIFIFGILLFIIGLLFCGLF